MTICNGTLWSCLWNTAVVKECGRWLHAHVVVKGCFTMIRSVGGGWMSACAEPSRFPDVLPTRFC